MYNSRLLVNLERDGPLHWKIIDPHLHILLHSHRADSHHVIIHRLVGRTVHKMMSSNLWRLHLSHPSHSSFERRIGCGVVQSVDLRSYSGLQLSGVDTPVRKFRIRVSKGPS
jgi:hypothetical protein